MLSRLFSLTLTLLLAASSAGCMLATPGLGNQRQALEEQLPGARFDRSFGVKLGRISLGLARGILRAAEDGDEDVEQAMAMLRHLDGVQVALYKTVDLPAIDAASFRPPRARTRSGDWFVAADVRGQGHVGWAIARTGDRGLVREILVGALDEDQLVLVRVKGDVEAMLEHLEETKQLDLPGLIRADLDPAEGEPVAVLDGQPGT